MFYSYNFRDELSSYVKIVRERSNNSLTGFTLPKIIDMVDKVRKEKESKKQGNYIISYSPCLSSKCARVCKL